MHAGVFNISNKLFVTMDILFEMRCHIKQGEPPSNTAKAVIECLFPISPQASALTSEEKAYLERKLYDGYYAFEAITDRNWDDAVCGICGIAPVFESGDGNAKNCTPLNKGQVNLE